MPAKTAAKTDGALLPGNLLPFTLYEELLHRGASKTAAPATKVVLVTRGSPPLGIFWSVSNKNSSESVASSCSLRFHWELQSRAVSNQPSWIFFFCNFVFLLEMGFRHVGQDGLDLLTLIHLPHPPKVLGLQV